MQLHFGQRDCIPIPCRYMGAGLWYVCDTVTVRFLVRTVHSIKGVLLNVCKQNLQLNGQLGPQAALTPA